MRRLSTIAALLALASPAAAECNQTSGDVICDGCVNTYRLIVEKNTTCTYGVRTGAHGPTVIASSSRISTVQGFRIVRRARHGTVGVSGTTNYAYRPAPNFVGADSFRVELSFTDINGRPGKTTYEVDVVVR